LPALSVPETKVIELSVLEIAETREVSNLATTVGILMPTGSGEKIDPTARTKPVIAAVIFPQIENKSSVMVIVLFYKIAVFFLNFYPLTSAGRLPN
jgi:hypothetical protein